MCSGAIYWVRIDRIYYGNTRVVAARIGFDDEFLYTEIVEPPERHKIPMVRLLEAEVQGHPGRGSESLTRSGTDGLTAMRRDRIRKGSL